MSFPGRLRERKRERKRERERQSYANRTPREEDRASGRGAFRTMTLRGAE